MTPPYPPETRAKGWRFELDYEQIEQSSTWALAAIEVRPWLLMLWLTAWKQVPCGSLPSDEEVVAAMIGMNPKAWAKHHRVLLRGWHAATDGRLYHETLSTRVREMLARRRSDADRKALERTRKLKDVPVTPDGVTTESRVTPAGLTRESSTGTDNLQPSLSSKEKVARKRAPSFDPTAIELPDWLDRSLWQEWCEERKTRGKAITERAAREQLASLDEYRRAGHSPERVIRHAIGSGNQGLYPPPKVSRLSERTVPLPDDAEKTAAYLRDQTMTPEQRIASEEVRKRVMVGMGIGVKAA